MRNRFSFSFVLIAAVGSLLLHGPICQAQQKPAPNPPPSPIAPAEKPADGNWDEIDQRLIFLMVRLANLEASLDAVNGAIGKTNLKVTGKTTEAKRAQEKNESMDRKGGGPMHWSQFYGMTAERFFYHPTDQNSTYHTETLLVQKFPGTDLKTEGVPSNQGTPAHQRPPQFDYIYRANESAKANAEKDTAEFKGKIDKLLERRNRLEAEQADLWVQIAFRSIQHYDLDQKPVFRFEPVAEQQHDADSMKPAVLFMSAALSIISDAEKNQAATFGGIKSVISKARQDLNDTWLRLGIDAKDRKTNTGTFAALAKKLNDVSSNLSESYIVAMEGDQENDQRRKMTFRGTLQESLVSYAQIILALDEMSELLKADWKVKPNLDKPIYVVSRVTVESPAPKLSKPDDDEDSKKPAAVNVKSKFKGKASYDAKTGELTIKYDFRNADQLNDFVMSQDGSAKIQSGKMVIGASDRVTHTAEFKRAKISVELQPKAALGWPTLVVMNNTFVRGHTEDDGKKFFLELVSISTEQKWEVIASSQFRMTSPLIINYEVFEKKVKLDFEGKEIAGMKLIEGNAGRVQFAGGQQGMIVSNLVLRGVPTSEWTDKLSNE